MDRTFGRSVKSAFSELEAQLAEFRSDDQNARLAIEFATTAWSIADWVFPAVGPALGFAKLNQFQEHLRSQCPELAYMQDICTEAKHGTITFYSPLVQEATDATVFEPGVYEVGVYEQGLKITTTSAQEIMFLAAAERVADYWRSFLARSGLL